MKTITIHRADIQLWNTAFMDITRFLFIVSSCNQLVCTAKKTTLKWFKRSTILRSEILEHCQTWFSITPSFVKKQNKFRFKHSHAKDQESFNVFALSFLCVSAAQLNCYSVQECYIKKIFKLSSLLQSLLLKFCWNPTVKKNK